jgi:Trk-type K+ transport system membrane component
MNSNLVVFVILGIAFAAVGVHLVLYSKHRTEIIRRFAEARGFVFTARADSTLVSQLEKAFDIEEAGCVRTFDQVRDVVSLPSGTIFRAVELLDLNPHASAVNPHHPRAAVMFSTQPEWFGIFHVTSDLAVLQRYPLEERSAAEDVRRYIQEAGMSPPPHPLSLTLMRGYGLAYLEPPVVGSVTDEHLKYLAELSARLSSS